MENTEATIENLASRVVELETGINKLIDLQERSAVRYKACFGKENPGGEQIYQYFAMQLRGILTPVSAIDLTTIDK